jgi:hypothetical protein
MGSKIWFCALCSEGFTRRYSANRHNQNLHQDQGKIVRTIDYIIGRLANKYSPGDPLTYRARYKQIDSSITRSDVKAFSFPLESKLSIAHGSSQRKSSGGLPPHGKERTPDQLQQLQPQVFQQHLQQRQSNSNSVQPSIGIPSTGSTMKFQTIQQLARALCSPLEAELLLGVVSQTIIQNGGKEEILDRIIENLTNAMNIKEAQRYLFAAPIKETDKRRPLHGHDVQHLSESSRDKLIQIKQILEIRLKNDVAVFEEIKRLIKVLNHTRDDTILDAELDGLLRSTPRANN